MDLYSETPTYHLRTALRASHEQQQCIRRETNPCTPRPISDVVQSMLRGQLLLKQTPAPKALLVHCLQAPVCSAGFRNRAASQCFWQDLKTGSLALFGISNISSILCYLRERSDLQMFHYGELLLCSECQGSHRRLQRHVMELEREINPPQASYRV